MDRPALRPTPARPPRTALAAAALAAAALAGCSGGPGGDAPVVRHAVLDVRGLFGTAARPTCASVAATLRLGVTDADGRAQTLERTLTAADTVVRLPLRLAPGPATFALDVRSNLGVPLYARTTTATVERDGFAVTINPGPAVTAVLKGCPSVLALTGRDGVYRDTLVLRNSGSVRTDVRVAAISATCGQPTCLFLYGFSGALAPSATEYVVADAGNFARAGVRAFDVRFESVVGNTTVGSFDVRFTLN